MGPYNELSRNEAAGKTGKKTGLSTASKGRRLSKRYRLALHPQKTKIVFCKKSGRLGSDEAIRRRPPPGRQNVIKRVPGT